MDLNELWNSAKQKYEDLTDTNLTTEELFEMLPARGSVDDVLAALEKQMETFRAFRSGDPKWKTLRNWLKPVVHFVASLSEATGKGVALAFPAGKTIFAAIGVLLIATKGVSASYDALAFPAGKTIFAAIGVLLMATKGVSASYDALVDLFETLKAFLHRLKIRQEIQFISESRETAVKTLAELLSALALATKLMRRSRLG
ncbi:hypothetical protein OF83DRAFT_1180066 [Amylostereum chailletii]|nr:hypothetical protein OF83DRAFT_1180066 [Amylostereum chailletii]